jgi:hypothetical protein
VDPFRKFCLIEGLDDIGLTLRHEAALDAFEAKHDEATWLKAKDSFQLLASNSMTAWSGFPGLQSETWGTQHSRNELHTKKPQLELNELARS